MTPMAWLEEVLASGEASGSKIENGVFECPLWRLLLRLIPTWLVIVLSSYAVVFHSEGGFQPWSLLLVVAFFGFGLAITRSVRRVRLEGSRVVAEFGGRKTSESWDIHSLSIDEPTGMRWLGYLPVRERATGRLAFYLLPDLAGWPKLAAAIREAGDAA